MRHRYSPPVAADWQARLASILTPLLPQHFSQRGCSPLLITRLAAVMAALRCTLAHACARLQLSIGPETIRKAWTSALLKEEPRQQLLQDSLAAWMGRLSRSRRKRGWDVAVDLVHEPFYGRSSADIFHGACKQGTRKFWSVATAAIVHQGERFTLAVAAVRNNRMTEVLDALWPQLLHLNLRIRRLLLDRGFYSAKVVRWLNARKIPFLMPMIRRGRPGRGTTPFFRRGRSGFSCYEWRERDHGAWVSAGVAMVPHHDRRRGPRVYLYGGRPPNLEQIPLIYRRRFGIESSYRQCHQSLGWTTSRNADWRRFLVVLSFVLRNLWITEKALPQPSGEQSRQTYPLYLAQLTTLVAGLTTQPSTSTRLAEGP